jgi:hypothetical protein
MRDCGPLLRSANLFLRTINGSTFDPEFVMALDTESLDILQQTSQRFDCEAELLRLCKGINQVQAHIIGRDLLRAD